MGISALHHVAQFQEPRKSRPGGSRKRGSQGPTGQGGWPGSLTEPPPAPHGPPARNLTCFCLFLVSHLLALLEGRPREFSFALSLYAQHLEQSLAYHRCSMSHGPRGPSSESHQGSHRWLLKLNLVSVPTPEVQPEYPVAPAHPHWDDTGTPKPPTVSGANWLLLAFPLSASSTTFHPAAHAGARGHRALAMLSPECSGFHPRLSTPAFALHFVLQATLLASTLPQSESLSLQGGVGLHPAGRPDRSLTPPDSLETPLPDVPGPA